MTIPQLFQGASVLVTGGTGSFGKRCVRALLADGAAERLVILSRDELKQHEMQRELSAEGHDLSRTRFFIGDVRDLDRLRQAFHGVDYVVHAAALKQVPACEYNPFEAIKTNVLGGQNVIRAAIDAGVKRVVALSTDKACSPVNLYGATKLCSDKLFVAGNAYAGDRPTRFAVVRYGNVVGSRGSVVPLFMKQRESGRLTITHADMTRFWITLDQGVDFVLQSFERMEGGELFVPKIPSMKVTDLARAIAPDAELVDIGIRPGEKLHEMMISSDDARDTVEFEDYYVLDPSRRAGASGTPVGEGFQYSSDSNSHWLNVEQIREIVAPFENPSP